MDNKLINSHVYHIISLFNHNIICIIIFLIVASYNCKRDLIIRFLCLKDLSLIPR